MNENEDRTENVAIAPEPNHNSAETKCGLCGQTLDRCEFACVEMYSSDLGYD